MLYAKLSFKLSSVAFLCKFKRIAAVRSLEVDDDGSWRRWNMTQSRTYLARFNNACHILWLAPFFAVCGVVWQKTLLSFSPLLWLHCVKSSTAGAQKVVKRVGNKMWNKMRVKRQKCWHQSCIVCVLWKQHTLHFYIKLCLSTKSADVWFISSTALLPFF